MTRPRNGRARVRFGDVVRLSTERCTDPVAAGIERYVGLEHLEPRDLRIRTWGNVADGVTFTNRFRPRQVLFGKRRAYQRKVAVAEFDGICSSDIYVFEPADGRLLSDLLPFICQTDGFFQHALKTSAGSLSPRTNWSSLADYEFDLPPLEEQERAIGALTQATRVIQHGTILSAALDNLRAAYLRAAFDELRCPTQAVAELTDSVSKGESPRWQGYEYVEQGPLFVTSEHVLEGTLSLVECKRIPDAFHRKLERSAIRGGDVLINLVGASIGRAAIAPNGLGPANTNQAVAVVRFDTTRMLPEFFLAWYLSPSTQQSIAATRVNTARANVSLTDIRQLKVPVPPLAVQREVVTRSHSLTTARHTNTSRADMAAIVQQKLLSALALS